MIDFIKRIISLSSEKVTILLWRGPTHDVTETYVIIPRKLFGMVAAAYLAGLFVVFLFFFLTPLGTLIFNREDQAVREQIIDIAQRIEVLRDSLYASEIQLADFKQALAEGSDTTFVTGYPRENISQIYEQYPESMLMTNEQNGTGNLGFGINEIVMSNRNFFSGRLEFPLQFPLQGSLTRTFETATGHFGIDIAAEKGTIVSSFADGVILFSGFTINYGHVVVIQHSDNFMSIYKHLKNPAKLKGDVVRRGDVLGSVGSDGLISTGPHLHFELWRNGMPVNPSRYFQNLN